MNGKQVKSGNLKKSNAVSDIGEALDRNVATFTLFLLLKVSNFVKCAHGISHNVCSTIAFNQTPKRNQQTTAYVKFFLGPCIKRNAPTLNHTNENDLKIFA
jgi:hypothetical protein